MKKSLIVKIVGVIALVAAITAMILFYKSSVPKTTDGAKSITITVSYQDGKTEDYSIKTDAKYLEGAMKDSKLTYKETDGMVLWINNVRADYNLDGAYWCFYLNGEMCNFGIKEQPVNDGDKFQIVYTKA